jgi:phage terminase large subunit-like protein
VPTLAPDLTAAEREAVLAELRRRSRPDWREVAHPEQLPPDGPWNTLLLRGGRGSGKTWAGARVLAELIEADAEPGKWGVVAPTFGEARDKCIEGEAGLLAAFGTSRPEVDAGRSVTVRQWNRSLGQMTLIDGAQVLIDGADDGAMSIQGENLRGCWCDEIGLWKKWRLAWFESIGFALRKGDAKIIATGTPKRHMPARELMRDLLKDPAVVTRRLRTEDNRENLSEAFYERVRRHEGTELGRQELEGELIEEVEGALWRFDWIDAHRRSERPYTWQKRRVALDPADGTESGAEHGVAVVGQGGDWGLYVLESHGFRDTPLEFCKRVIEISERHGRATVVIEKNHGGAWLPATLEAAMREVGRTVPYQLITASRSKYERAEPVAMLYEQGKVHHLGVFPELEEQMTSFTGAQNEPSPDRLDALVHGLTELMGGNIHGAVEPELARAVPWREKPFVAGAVPWQ